MSMIIAPTVSAITADKPFRSSLSKLSSGRRINADADGIAGFAIPGILRSRLRDEERAARDNS